MGTLEYGDSVRQMERLKDAAMRQRPPFVQSEERAAWRDSSRRNLDQRRFILDYYRDVIHSASESRRNVAERSFHDLVEICCAHCVLIPNAGSSGIVAKNHAARVDGGYSGQPARQRALSGNAASQTQLPGGRPHDRNESWQRSSTIPIEPLVHLEHAQEEKCRTSRSTATPPSHSRWHYETSDELPQTDQLLLRSRPRDSTSGPKR
jgi:hypothetical protein